MKNDAHRALNLCHKQSGQVAERDRRALLIVKEDCWIVPSPGSQKYNFNEMENQMSNWNGFKIHGDTSELDKIVEHGGMISLDLNDITSTLSESGENYITDGLGANISEAFNDAVHSLPVPISTVEKLLIQFYIGAKQPNISELSVISKTLSNGKNNLQVMWGVSKIENLGDDIKVVLVASLSK